MKHLSIIIPSYNVEKYLRNTVSSFWSERINDDIEIIIVNDGSKDNTLKLAKALQDESNATIKIIDKENGGHGSTINRGIQEAEGRYIKVVDGDDWVNTEEFVKYVTYLKGIDVDAVFTPFTRVSEADGSKVNIGYDKLEFFKIYDFFSVIKELGESYQMHSLTFKTEILKRIPPIDEHTFYVDQEYILYPIGDISTIVSLPYYVYQYRVGMNEQSVSISSKQRNRDMHKKVINSLLLRKKDQSGNYSKEVFEFLNSRLANLSAHQVEIYLSMNTSKKTKNELKDFLNFIKREDKEVFDCIPGKNTHLLLKSNYLLYSIIACAFKEVRGIKNE